MEYPEQEEIIFTAREAALLRRLLAVMQVEMVEKFVATLEEVNGCEYARVTVVWRNGHARYIEQTKGID